MSVLKKKKMKINLQKKKNYYRENFILLHILIFLVCKENFEINVIVIKMPQNYCNMAQLIYSDDKIAFKLLICI